MRIWSEATLPAIGEYCAGLLPALALFFRLAISLHCLILVRDPSLGIHLQGVPQVQTTCARTKACASTLQNPDPMPKTHRFVSQEMNRYCTYSHLTVSLHNAPLYRRNLIAFTQAQSWRVCLPASSSMSRAEKEGILETRGRDSLEPKMLGKHS